MENNTRCIATGADEDHEWMLPWWYENYTKHNTTPIVFGNFGMSSTMVKWCASRGKVIDLVSNMPMIKNWFKKPSIITRCGYEQCIMMDSDCQVQSNLDFMFDKYCRVGWVGLTRDTPTQFNTQFTKNPVAAGVVVTYSDNELIREWEHRCLNETELRGDQEVLIKLLTDRNNSRNLATKIVLMPPECQWLRLQGKRTDVPIMHWSGRIGKETIRGMIVNENNENI